MTMAQDLIYVGIYLAIGIVIVSIFRLTLRYSILRKPKHSLTQPNFFEIFIEIMLWPFILLFLIPLFSESLINLLCKIGICISRVSRKRRR